MTDALVIDRAGEGKGRTLIETAYATLRNEIIDGTLEPGAKLRTEELRARYDVSGSTIREALTRLIGEALVTSEGQRGFRVANASLEDFRDLTAVRKLIETEALRQAIEVGGETLGGRDRRGLLQALQDRGTAARGSRRRLGRVRGAQPRFPPRPDRRLPVALAAPAARPALPAVRALPAPRRVQARHSARRPRRAPGHLRRDARPQRRPRGEARRRAYRALGVRAPDAARGARAPGVQKVTSTLSPPTSSSPTAPQTTAVCLIKTCATYVSSLRRPPDDLAGEFRALRSGARA